jgi:transposase
LRGSDNEDSISVSAQIVASTNQHWRTIGALNALTGQVNYLDGYIVGRQQVVQFYSQLDRAYPEVALIYGSQDHWNIHTHPDVLLALERYPRITPVGLPTSAPWLNPIEKLWRGLRHAILKLHRRVEDWPQVKHRVHDFLDQFARGSPALLCGVSGKGKLATVLNTS